MSPVKAIPEGYHSVQPYLYIRGAAQAIEFYKKAFGATEIMRMPAAGWAADARGNPDWRFDRDAGR